MRGERREDRGERGERIRVVAPRGITRGGVKRTQAAARAECGTLTLLQPLPALRT